MATMAGRAEETGVSIGGILSRAFGVMGNNPIVVFGLSFLFGAVPAQVYTYFLTTLRNTTADPIVMTAITGGSVLIFVMFSMLAQGGIIRASVAYAQGERASFGECISVGLSKALPLFGLSLLFIFGMMFGFLLFFIPGVILVIMWSVSAPALIAEPIGVFRAFGRSRYLTKGARWKIFGMLLLMLVLFWILSAIVGVLMFTIGIESLQVAMLNGDLPIWYMAMSVVSSTITTALMTTIVTALYISLRNWKDGPQAEALADIFA